MIFGIILCLILAACYSKKKQKENEDNQVELQNFNDVPADVNDDVIHDDVNQALIDCVIYDEVPIEDDYEEINDIDINDPYGDYYDNIDRNHLELIYS